MASAATADEDAGAQFRRQLLAPTAMVAVLGLVFVALGLFVLDGVWAGMLGLWGLTLVGLAVLFRLAAYLLRTL